MAKLEILIAPDRRLRTRCAEVDGVDARVARLVDDMFETMYAAKGIGLAAPQVGVLERIVVVDCARGEGEEPQPLALVNPEILDRSEEVETESEGCLSLPEIYVDVPRPAAVRVRYLDRGDTVRELAADGLLARCIQHEIDHLNGRLHVDHLSAVKRNYILRKLGKSKRRDAP